MPFSFNLNNFGRWNAQPSAPRPFTTGGLAPAYDNGSNGPDPACNSMPPVGNPQPGMMLMMSSNQIRTATRPRLGLSALSSFCLFVTVVFLIMVEIGNTYDKPVLRDIWFIKLDIANVNAPSNSTPGLGYAIAEDAGFYDFYQIGLWNYCEGWNSSGIANCTKPHSLYWWNPIEMFTEQIYGTTNNTLPPEMYSSLGEIRVCSHWMFGLFMAGACLSFVLIPIVLIGVKSRWCSLGLGVVTFLNMICVLAATIISTALWVIMRNIFKDYEEIVDIVPHIGTTMFVMMWIAAAFTIFAFVTQVFLSCFLASERDLRHGVSPKQLAFF